MNNELEIKKIPKVDVNEIVDALMNVPLSNDRIEQLKKQGIELDPKLYTGALDLVLSQMGSISKKDNTKAFEYLINMYNNNYADEGAQRYDLPAHLIARSFVDVYRDIRSNAYSEYIFKGGRGSTKSTFISQSIITIMNNHPEVHCMITRKVANTLRTSVFAQVLWAIEIMGLSHEWKKTVSPLELTNRNTGQKIYFRGGDEPEKIKAIKPEHGYIGILWAEEIDQFDGEEGIRMIEQSALRGGPIAIKFKSFNAPKSQHHWINNYVLIPNDKVKVHHSTYKDTPLEWLGQPFIDDAEHLKEVNPDAYRHEYLGEVIGMGSNVFDNVQLREMTDDEISNFEYLYFGQDWGWYPDPNRLVGMSYDANNRILYIFREEDGNKMTSEMWADRIVDLIEPYFTITADNNERKSISDMKGYGFNMREAIKGPGSVHEGFKWLAGLTKIVVDPVRCPKTSQELIKYEYTKTKDGKIITDYPDFDNHSLAAIRYATERIWHKRGA